MAQTTNLNWFSRRISEPSTLTTRSQAPQVDFETPHGRRLEGDSTGGSKKFPESIPSQTICGEKFFPSENAIWPI